MLLMLMFLCLFKIWQQQQQHQKRTQSVNKNFTIIEVTFMNVICCLTLCSLLPVPLTLSPQPPPPNTFTCSLIHVLLSITFFPQFLWMPKSVSAWMCVYVCVRVCKDNYEHARIYLCTISMDSNVVCARVVFIWFCL